MSFFTPSAELSRIGALVETLAAERFKERGVPSDQFAYVLLRPNAPGEAPSGAALRAERQAYPCSLVKVFFLVAAQAWLEKGAIEPHEELDRAMRDMIPSRRMRPRTTSSISSPAPPVTRFSTGPGWPNGWIGARR